MARKKKQALDIWDVLVLGGVAVAVYFFWTFVGTQGLITEALEAVFTFFIIGGLFYFIRRKTGWKILKK